MKLTPPQVWRAKEGYELRRTDCKECGQAQFPPEQENPCRYCRSEQIRNSRPLIGKEGGG